jgi:hypothetical protein
LKKSVRSIMGRRAARARRRKGQPGKGRDRYQRNWWIYLVVPALVTILLGVGIPLLVKGVGLGKSPGDSFAGIPVPGYIASAPFPVREAYAYAVQSPGVLRYIPCYCGCGMHSGHTSNHDCFVKERRPDGTILFDSHGVNCDMCVEIALDSKKLTSQGKSLQEVRQFVERRYGYMGPPTETPPPP